MNLYMDYDNYFKLENRLFIFKWLPLEILWIIIKHALVLFNNL